MAEEAQQGRHAVDGSQDLGRRAAFGGSEGRAHIDQMAQHRELQVWRTLGHDAVVQHVALHELREPRQCLLEALLEVLAVAQEGQVDEDQRLEGSDRLVADQAGVQRAPEMGALAGEREDEAGRKARIGGGRQPVVVADPRDDALGQHLALPGDGRPAALAVRPVVDQPDGQCRRGGIAAIAQVAQPAKAVQGIHPQGGRAEATPRRVVRFGRHGAGAAASQKLAHDQALPDGWIAWPAVGRHGEERAR